MAAVVEIGAFDRREFAKHILLAQIEDHHRLARVAVILREHVG